MIKQITPLGSSTAHDLSARYMHSPDTRSAVINPNELVATKNGVQFDFKQASVTGLTGYSGVLSYRPYASNSDWSGGPAHQIAFNNSNGLYWRVSTGDTTWGDWKQLVTNSGTWGISITGNAATATKLSNTPNNTNTFLRGDNTWNSTLTDKLTVYNSGRGESNGDVYTGGIELREYKMQTTTLEDTYKNAPGITFHWGGHVVNKLNIRKDGALYWGTTKVVTNSGTWGISITGNAATATTATKLGTSTVGSARQPIYLNGGTATAANYTVAHFGNAGKSNMNDVGRLHSSMGMTNLTDPGNTTDNPGNQTSWHHYISISYADDPNGSNAWVTQIANKAGTTDLWVRSRSGGTITNGTAWVAPWTRILTEKNISNTLHISGMNLLPNTQTMEGWTGTENRTETPFPWCYSHTVAKGSSSYADIAYNSVFTPEPNEWYTLSYWARASAATAINNYFYSNGPQSGYNSDGKTTTATDGEIAMNIGTTWKHYWVTWQARADVSGAKNIILARISTDATVYIALPKLEKGKNATDWTCNPGDGIHLYGRTGNTNILYNGGGSTATDYSLILHGNSTNGTSGIAFLSSKGNTAINYPSDRAFIQYHPYGITTYTAEGTAPTLATSGEANQLVIGVGNDSNDQVRLQTPGRTGLLHQVGNTGYVIPDTGNTTGTVGSATQPVYINGGVITAATSYADATVKTADYPTGFSSRSTNATWGNQTGTTITCWNESDGGSVDWRRNNPSSGKVSLKVDGRFYGNEGTYPAMLMKEANGYWGLANPDATDNVWIRTTTLGLLPYQSGGVGAGHGSLGTDSWRFSTAYIDTTHSHQLLLEGATNATMTAASTNPRITFQESTGTQPVHLIYTDYDNYRGPAGLKIIGGASATPAWLEVEGNVYAAAFKGNADTATALTTNAGSATQPVYFSSGKPVAATAYSGLLTALSWTGGTTAGPTLSITVGGTTKTATIPSASASASGVVTTTTQTFAGEKTFSNRINLANGTLNKIGDDAALGDTNVAGCIGIKGLNNTSTGIHFITGTTSSDLTTSTTGGQLRYNGSNFQINSHFLPNANLSYSLGDVNNAWSQGFIGRNRILNNTSAPGQGDILLGSLGLKTGYPVYTDPTFLSGTNSVGIYNNTSGGNVVHTRDTYSNLGVSSPGTNSNYIIKIENKGAASPGIGGFVQNISSRANAQFIQIFRALIPVGRNVQTASNSMGATYQDQWLTSQAGTGKWEWYARRVLCGQTGTFSGGGHVYLDGAAGTADAPVVWYLAACNLYDVTRMDYDGLRVRESDAVHDYNNGTLTTFGYSTAGMTSTSWLGSWDGYKLRAISPANAVKSAVGTTAIGSTSVPVYWTGSAFAAITSYSGTSTNASNLLQNTRMDYGWSGINYFNISAANQSAAKVNDTPFASATWTHILRFNHANNSGYYTDLAVPFNANGIYYKRIAGGSLQNSSTNGGWVKVLDQLNYTDYTVTKTGTGASGTWGINITGTATKLSNTPNNTTTFLRGDNTWTNQLTNTFYSTASPGFQNQVAAGSWAYLRLHNSSNYFDIATNSSQNSGCLDFRPAGASNIGPRILTSGRIDAATSNSSDSNYGGAAIQIRENAYGGAGTDSWGRAPRLSFHWSGRVAAQIGLASNGYLYTAPSTGTTFYKLVYENGTWGISITGNAATATKWATARTLTIGYKGQTVDGSANVTWDLHDILKSNTNISTATSWDQTTPGVYYVSSNAAYTGTSNPESNTKDGTAGLYRYGQLIVSKAGTGGLAQFYIAHNDSADSANYGIHFRTGWNGSYLAKWRQLIDSGNYTNWTVTKTGTGASGTWGISITGNSATATKLATARSIGLTGAVVGSANFDGSGNITITTTPSTASDNRYVLKVGDTMTGDLTVQTSSVPNQSTIIQAGNVVVGNLAGLLEIYSDSAAAGNRGIRGVNSSNGTTVSYAYIGQDDQIHCDVKLWGAVWNDYAEMRNVPEAQKENDSIKPGSCVREVGDGTMALTTERLQKGCKIISDTFGFNMGETEECKTPIAVAGRALVYLYEGRDAAKDNIGEFVCSGPNGTVSLMTTEEYFKCPQGLVGTISEVPDYDTWGTDNIKVDGRIWIYVK